MRVCAGRHRPLPAVRPTFGVPGRSRQPSLRWREPELGCDIVNRLRVRWGEGLRQGGGMDLRLVVVSSLFGAPHHRLDEPGILL
jgi:hypothetical protein